MNKGFCDNCGYDVTVCDCYDNPIDEEPDEYEEALGNCSGFMDGGYFVCGAAGSEECDWECPFSGDLGKSAKELEEEAGEEVDE